MWVWARVHVCGCVYVWACVYVCVCVCAGVYECVLACVCCVYVCVCVFLSAPMRSLNHMAPTEGVAYPPRVCLFPVCAYFPSFDGTRSVSHEGTIG